MTPPELRKHHSDFRPSYDLALNYLRRCPRYSPTPVIQLKLENKQVVLVKDETNRMGLGAFKALGAIYAMARIIKDLWDEANGYNISPDGLFSEELRGFSGNLGFVCASAGNHGIALAVGAKLFGAKAFIHLPENAPDTFEKRLLEYGATVLRSAPTYDECVAAAIEDADTNDKILLADTSWKEYLQIPSLVMEGYCVIAEELRETFEKTKAWPSHVFIQAGVGGLAGAMTHMIRHNWLFQPKIIIAEPEAAPCLRDSAKLNQITNVSGPSSIMGRLDCKIPSLLAYEILQRAGGVEYTTISDYEAEKSCKKLKSHGISTTPSGAAGFAALEQFNNNSSAFADSISLVFATEIGTVDA